MRFLLLQLIDEEMQSQENLKQRRITLKSEADDKDNDISEIRKRQSAQNKQINSVQKQITSIETKLEHKRADKHRLLITCKVRFAPLMQLKDYSF